MKRVIVVILVVILAFSITACGGTTTVTDEGKRITVGSVEELEELVDKDVTDTIAALQTEYESLAEEVDTYDKYIANVDRIGSYYDQILNDTRAICIRLREYSICYVEIVMKSGGSYKDKYDTRSDLYDLIYDDACGEIYDAMYDDLLGDMYDFIYEGVIRDGYDYAPYDKWYDTSSEAYDIWYDCKSDVYDEWYDAKSDIYDFWYDVYGHFYDDDEQAIKEEITEFREDIEMLRSEE